MRLVVTRKGHTQAAVIASDSDSELARCHSPSRPAYPAHTGPVSPSVGVSGAPAAQRETGACRPASSLSPHPSPRTSPSSLSYMRCRSRATEARRRPRHVTCPDVRPEWWAGGESPADWCGRRTSRRRASRRQHIRLAPATSAPSCRTTGLPERSPDIGDVKNNQCPSRQDNLNNFHHSHIFSLLCTRSISS